MPRLIVLRHAKAESYSESDFTRPLSQRGRSQTNEIATAMRRWLTSEAAVLVSPAVRTQETWQLTAKAAGFHHLYEQEPLMYNGSAGTLFALMQQQSADTVVMVGHNPGVARLAGLLAASTSAEEDALLSQYGTGTFAVLECDTVWRDWAPGCAELREVFTPGQ